MVRSGAKSSGAVSRESRGSTATMTPCTWYCYKLSFASSVTKQAKSYFSSMRILLTGMAERKLFIGEGAFLQVLLGVIVGRCEIFLEAVFFL